VMCEYVKSYPNHPGGLIFCNTEAKMDIDAMVEQFKDLGGEEVAEICRKNYLAPTAESVEAYRDKCIPFYAKNAYSKQEIQRCIQRMEIFENYCKNEFKHFDYLGKLDKVQCPTLFMVGEKSPGHPPKLAKMMAEKIKPELVSYHEFKDAGSPVYKDAEQESEAVVRNFLMKVS